MAGALITGFAGTSCTAEDDLEMEDLGLEEDMEVVEDEGLVLRGGNRDWDDKDDRWWDDRKRDWWDRDWWNRDHKGDRDWWDDWGREWDDKYDRDWYDDWERDWDDKYDRGWDDKNDRCRVRTDRVRVDRKGRGHRDIEIDLDDCIDAVRGCGDRSDVKAEFVRIWVDTDDRDDRKGRGIRCDDDKIEIDGDRSNSGYAIKALIRVENDHDDDKRDFAVCRIEVRGRNDRDVDFDEVDFVERCDGRRRGRHH